MANKVNVEVQVTSNIDEQTRSAKVLRKELEGSQKAAAGATRAASDTKAYAAASAAAASSTEKLEYGIARASVGTGAAGRDFAKQAQGLGGLVHVYATFAANLFAVSAAFLALKNAADTTSMIKGLDQLGAASGRGLGTLSKEIVALTDGAVTLREAMEATAKATAAGMSSADLKRLAVGAKNASQALGVDMSDALSRLSRGITKLEPELLDELGIFVRVDKAAADYARTLGKPASALTDFEKRAGFAAATLEQVEKKFGSIQIDSNPYNQLSASLSQVLQSGLELINYFLTPVLRLLSSSPTALAIAVGAVGAALLKQAIPALGSFKESMRAAAEVSKDIANSRMVEAKRVHIEELKNAKIAAEAMADATLEASEAAQKKLEVSQANSFKKQSKAYAILNMNYADIDEKHFKELEKQQARFSTSHPEIAERYKVATDALRAWVAAENDLTVASKKAAQAYTDSHGQFSTMIQLERIANKANQEAMSRNIVANAAYSASTQGFTKSMVKMWAEVQEARKASTQKIEVPQYDKFNKPVLDELGNQIKLVETISTKGLGNVATGFTVIKSTVAAATTSVSTFLNAFGVWAQVAGLVIAGMSILIDKFSATTKEAKATADSFTTLTAAVETIDRTLSRIEGLDPLEALSVENIQAKATALTELSAALTSSIKKAFEESSKMNWLDKEINTIKGYFGADLADNLAETLGIGIATALKTASNSQEALKAREKITGILGDVDLEDPKALQSVIEDLLDTGALSKEMTLELGKAIEVMGNKSAVAAAKGTELKTAMEVTNKAAQDVITSFMPSDALSKFAVAIIAESDKMAEAVAEPTQRMNALKMLMESPAQLSLLDEATRNIFLENSDAINEAIVSTASYDKHINYLTKEIDRLGKVQEDIIDQTSGGILDVEGIKKTEDQITAVKGAVKTLKDEQAKTIEALNGKGINLDIISGQMFSKGAELFSKGISVEMARSAALIAKAYTGLAPGSMTASIVTTRADNTQLQLERDLIKSNISLIEAMYDNTQATQLNTLTSEKRAEESKIFGKDDQKIATLDASIKKLELSMKYVAEQRKSGGLAPGAKATDMAGAMEAAKAAGVDAATINRMMQLMSSNAAIYGKNMQIAANNIALMIKDRENTFKTEVDSLNITKEQNNLELTRLNTIRGIDGVLAPQLLAQKQSLEYSIAQIDADIKVKQAKQDLSNLELLIKKTGMENDAQAKKDLVNAQKKLTSAENNKKVTLETLKSRQDYDTASNELNTAKQLLDLEIQRSNAIASLGIITDVEMIKKQGELERQLAIQEQLQRKAEIERQIASAKEAADVKTENSLKAQLSFEEQINAKKLQNIDSSNKIKVVQAETNNIAASLNALFEGMNGSVGNFVSTVIKGNLALAESAKLYSDQLAENDKKRKEAEAKIKDPTSSEKEKIKAQDTINNLKEDDIKLNKANLRNQLQADAAMIGSAKKLFNEKSTAYKVLGGIEKAMHIASLAMEAEKIAVAIAGMVERIPVYAAEIFGATTGQLGIFGPIVAAGLVATLVAMAASAGGSGGGVSMPAPPSYEDLQKVQGTGQDYVGGTTTLASNNGGVLGDIAAKSEDIANSIDYIQSNSLDSLMVNNQQLIALKNIDYNTKLFASQLASAGFTGENSPLGTLAQASATTGTNISPLGISLFSSGSTSVSSSVEDWGVQIQGKLGELIQGIGTFVKYDLEKIVTTKSGGSILGFSTGGGGTSTQYRTNTQILDDNLQATIKKIMYDISQTVLSYGERLSTHTNDELKSIIDQQIVDFKISTKGLTGQEAYDAILAELGITTNKIVAKAYPFLETLARFGEGLLTTLTRITTNMQNVDKTFQLMGVSFSDKFLAGIVDTYQTKIEKVWTKVADEWQAVNLAPGTQVKYGANGAFAEGTVDTSGVVTFINDVFGDPIYGVFKAGFALLDTTITTAITAQERKLGIYESLIEKFGGEIDTFNEATQAYISSFIDQNTQLLAYQSTVSDTFNLQVFKDLNIAQVNTRAEFVNLVNSLDLTTDAGQTAFAALMNVAPAFDTVAKHIEGLVSSAGMAATDFAKILMDGITGTLKVSELGDKVATTIKDGILNAVASTYVTSISTAFTDLIITPIVTAVTTGATLTNVISSQAIANIRTIAVNAATAISTIFKDAGFVSAIQEATTLIGETIKGMAAVTQITTGSISKIIAKYNTKLIDAYKKQASEIQSTLNKFKGFSDSLKEFRDSLLTGALSPKTPLEKYNLALQDLDQTYALAMKGDETAIARLKTVAQNFLDMSREYYASSDAYVSDFDRVQRILDSTIGLVDTQVSDLERQLQVAQNQLTVLGYIDETAKSIEQLLAEANAGQKEEVGNVLSTGFVSLDKNFDGLLTMEELRTSGLASESELQNIYTAIDTNGDGQISMLEALRASTEGTTFSVNSLAPILEGIRNGTLSVKDAIDYLAQLNIANVGVGGTPINVSPDIFKTSEQLKLEWVQQYVQGAYRDILNREAEAGGLQYWTDQIVSGKLAITDLYSTIAQSDEAINSALKARVTDLDSYITNAYTMLLDRAPDMEGFNYWKQAIESNAMSVTDLYSSFLRSDEYLRNMANVVNQFNSLMSSVGTGGYSVPGFAEGGYHQGGLRIVGENGPELEATGEARIWTAAQTQQMLNGASTRNSQNGDLIAEIQRLNQKIESLERTVQQGDIMNMQATERNTQQVSGTIKDTTSTSVYANKLQQRAVIV